MGMAEKPKASHGPGDFFVIVVVLAFCAVALRHIIFSRKEEPKNQLIPISGTGGMDLLWNSTVKPAKESGPDSRPKRDSMIVWDEPGIDYKGSRRPKTEEPEEEPEAEEPPPEREEREDPLEGFPPEKPQPKPVLDRMPFSFMNDTRGGSASSSAFMPAPKPVQEAAPDAAKAAPAAGDKRAPAGSDNARRPRRSNSRR